MASWRENLETRLNNIAAELAAMGPTKMGGKANVKSQDGGTTIDHVGYRKSLLEEQAMLIEQLAKSAEVEASMNGTDGPFEVETDIETWML